MHRPHRKRTDRCDSSRVLHRPRDRTEGSKQSSVQASHKLAKPTATRAQTETQSQIGTPRKAGRAQAQTRSVFVGCSQDALAPSLPPFLQIPRHAEQVVPSWPATSRKLAQVACSPVRLRVSGSFAIVFAFENSMEPACSPVRLFAMRSAGAVSLSVPAKGAPRRARARLIEPETDRSITSWSMRPGSRSPGRSRAATATTSPR
jgi:hypothetical protein